MKKILPCFLIAIYFFTTQVQAEDGGLLTGKPLTISGGGGTTLNATDSNFETFVYLHWPSRGTNAVSYVFESPVNIYGVLADFRCVGNCNSSLQLTDTNGSTFTYNTTGLGNRNQNIRRFATEYKNIIMVRWANEASWEKNLYEFNVYGYSTDPPSQPTGLQGFRTGRNIDIIWDANPESIIGYNIYVNGNKVNSTPINDTRYTLERGAGTSNSIEVTAVNFELYESVRSASINIRVPSEVTNLRETHDHQSVTLTWTNPNNSYFNSVKIYRDGTLIDQVTTNRYTDTNVEHMTTYDYKVTVVETGGEESEGVPIQVTTDRDPDYRPPAPDPPKDIDHGNGEDEEGRHYIIITWTESEFAVRYEIYVDGLHVGSVPAGTTSYRYYPPVKKSHYNIEVIAVDEEGNESPPARNPTEAEKALPSVWEVIKTVFEMIALFSAFILLGLAIILSPWIVRFIYFIKKVAKQLNIKF